MQDHSLPTVPAFITVVLKQQSAMILVATPTMHIRGYVASYNVILLTDTHTHHAVVQGLILMYTASE